MPRKSDAQWLADDLDLAATLKVLNSVAHQCRIIEVDYTKPPKKKRAKKRTGKSEES